MSWKPVLWQEIVDDVKDLVTDCVFVHSCFADVRSKRKKVRMMKRIGGTDYENAVRELNIAKSWRRVHLRHVFDKNL